MNKLKLNMDLNDLANEELFRTYDALTDNALKKYENLLRGELVLTEIERTSKTITYKYLARGDENILKVYYHEELSDDIDYMIEEAIAVEME